MDVSHHGCSASEFTPVHVALLQAWVSQARVTSNPDDAGEETKARQSQKRSEARRTKAEAKADRDDEIFNSLRSGGSGSSAPVHSRGGAPPRASPPPPRVAAVPPAPTTPPNKRGVSLTIRSLCAFASNSSRAPQVQTKSGHADDDAVDDVTEVVPNNVGTFTFVNRHNLTPVYVVKCGSPPDWAFFLTDTNMFGHRNHKLHGPWAAHAALENFKPLFQTEHPGKKINMMVRSVLPLGGNTGDRYDDLCLPQQINGPARNQLVKNVRTSYDNRKAYVTSTDKERAATPFPGPLLPFEDGVDKTEPYSVRWLSA